MTEHKSEWHHCPNCNSITTVFDPPLVFEPVESCKEVHPKGHECDLAPNHEGDHVSFWMEEIIWPGQPDKN